MSFPFTKMQGAGNDFVVVEGEAHDWSALAPQLCDRNFGAGGDGVLVALPSTRADIRMRMYNPDGTEDDCGNGLRCLALYARQRGWVSVDEFRVQTLSGLKEVEVGPLRGNEAEIRASMGRAALAPAAIPADFAGDDALGRRLQVGDHDLEIHSLFTGTAHTVIFETPDESRFRELSPRIEYHARFPERTSILWAEVPTPDLARVRIWERGVGETLACGTGAAAVAVACHLSGRTGPEVAVQSKGGVLRVHVGDDLFLTMRGPAAFVYDGVWKTGRNRGTR